MVTTRRYHFPPTRMVIIKKIITSTGEDVEKPEPSHMAVGICKMVQPLWKRVWQFLKKLNVELPYMIQKLL